MDHPMTAQNENAPDSLSHGTLVEQPSPEVCSQPLYVVTLAAGMARTGYCGKSSEFSSEARADVQMTSGVQIGDHQSFKAEVNWRYAQAPNHAHSERCSAS
jgi:hypothetical protein